MTMVSEVSTNTSSLEITSIQNTDGESFDFGLLLGADQGEAVYRNPGKIEGGFQTIWLRGQSAALKGPLAVHKGMEMVLRALHSR